MSSNEILNRYLDSCASDHGSLFLKGCDVIVELTMQQAYLGGSTSYHGGLSLEGGDLAL